jgi:23S rRNA pseudouridine1911/1915/1917 synthase
MTAHLRVDAPARLVPFLRRALPAWKRSTLEQRIRAGCVRVNGATERTNALLAAGDEVLVDDAPQASQAAAGAPFPVLHADAELVAIDKPAGLLSVATDAGGGRSALALLRAALSRPGAPAPLWPVHRLDRETSGVLLFARTAEARASVQGAWDRAQKTYLAVVAGRPEPAEGAIERPLLEDERLNVRVSDDPRAKPARTRYRTVEARGERSLLEVALDTGRRHQIRAHLAWLGTPVVGDARHGPASPHAGPRLGLHALRLVLPHPADGRELVLEARAPRELLALLGRERG